MISEAAEKIGRGEHLSRGDAEAAMEEILRGRATDDQIVSLLSALRKKGETVEELVGFAMAMRRHAAPVFPRGRADASETLVDTCGTGGATADTFNVSTAAAFVVAGAGARVAKHGNRSFGSRCGSADVLEALGVSLDAPPERAGEAIEQLGIGFLFAPVFHAAMKHAIPARRALRVRTAFNLLGPLTNPAGASAAVGGVPEARLTELLARALGELGVRRAFVVHGADDLDEISLSGETRVSQWREGKVTSFAVSPEDFGLRRAPVEAIAGGDAPQNAEIVRSVLRGETGPRRDIVLANASAALVAAGRAADFVDGVRQSAQSIDSGAAHAKLEALISFLQKQH